MPHGSFWVGVWGRSKGLYLGLKMAEIREKKSDFSFDIKMGSKQYTIYHRLQQKTGHPPKNASFTYIFQEIYFFSILKIFFAKYQVQKWGILVWSCVLGRLVVFLTLWCLLELKKQPRYKLICSQSKNSSFPPVFYHFLYKNGMKY